MPDPDFLYPPVPGITGARELTANTAFTAGMRGKVIGLAGFTLTLAPLHPSKFGAFYVEGPGNIAGSITGVLSAGQAALIVVRDGGFSWGQAAVISVAGKSGAVALVAADIGGLPAALNQRLRFDSTITGLTGGTAGKLDAIPTAGGAMPLRSVIRLDLPEIGRLDYVLMPGVPGEDLPAGFVAPHFIRPIDFHLTENNAAWALAPANVASQFSVRPLINTTLGGSVALWNSAHTGAIALIAHNCDAGTDAVEFTKAGIVAMLSDVEPRAMAADVVHWNPGLVHRAGAHLNGLRGATGITRNRTGATAASASSDLAVSRITGFPGVDPNASWIPAHLWQEDRPTWRLSGQGLGYLISRSAAALWEIRINNVLALRGGTAGLEYPWQETVWFNFNGFGYTGGGPLIVPDSATPVEIVPPYLLPPERVIPLADAAVITPDFAAAKFFTVTLGGNRTLANPVNVAPGGYLLRVKQDGTGGRTLAWGNRFRFPAGQIPLLSTAAGAEDILSVVSFGGDELYVAANYNLQTP